MLGLTGLMAERLNSSLLSLSADEVSQVNA